MSMWLSRSSCDRTQSRDQRRAVEGEDKPATRATRVEGAGKGDARVAQTGPRTERIDSVTTRVKMRGKVLEEQKQDDGSTAGDHDQMTTLGGVLISQQCPDFIF